MNFIALDTVKLATKSILKSIDNAELIKAVEELCEKRIVEDSVINNTILRLVNDPFAKTRASYYVKIIKELNNKLEDSDFSNDIAIMDCNAKIQHLINLTPRELELLVELYKNGFVANNSIMISGKIQEYINGGNFDFFNDYMSVKISKLEVDANGAFIEKRKSSEEKEKINNEFYYNVYGCDISTLEKREALMTLEYKGMVIPFHKNLIVNGGTYGNLSNNEMIEVILQDVKVVSHFALDIFNLILE